MARIVFDVGSEPFEAQAGRKVNRQLALMEALVELLDALALGVVVARFQAGVGVEVEDGSHVGREVARKVVFVGKREGQAEQVQAREVDVGSFGIVVDDDVGAVLHEALLARHAVVFPVEAEAHGKRMLACGAGIFQSDQVEEDFVGIAHVDLCAFRQSEGRGKAKADAAAYDVGREMVAAALERNAEVPFRGFLLNVGLGVGVGGLKVVIVIAGVAVEPADGDFGIVSAARDQHVMRVLDIDNGVVSNRGAGRQGHQGGAGKE